MEVRYKSRHPHGEEFHRNIPELVIGFHSISLAGNANVHRFSILLRSLHRPVVVTLDFRAAALSISRSVSVWRFGENWPVAART